MCGAAACLQSIISVVISTTLISALKTTKNQQNRNQYCQIKYTLRNPSRNIEINLEFKTTHKLTSVDGLLDPLAVPVVTAVPQLIPELVFTLHQTLPGSERDRLHSLWHLSADTLLLICQSREGLWNKFFQKRFQECLSSLPDRLVVCAGPQVGHFESPDLAQ